MHDIRLPAGFVASMNQTTTQFFSTSRQEDRGQEFSSSLQNMMTAGQCTPVTHVLHTCYTHVTQVCTHLTHVLLTCYTHVTHVLHVSHTSHARVTHVSFVCFVPKVKQIVISALMHYMEKNNKLPDRIIVYRDGVSEGQFSVVKQYEVSNSVN